MAASTAASPAAGPAVAVAPAVRVRGLTVAYQGPAGGGPASTLELPAGERSPVWSARSGSGKSTLAPGAARGGPEARGRSPAGPGRGGRPSATCWRCPAAHCARPAAPNSGMSSRPRRNSLNPLKTIGKQLLDLGKSHDRTGPLPGWSARPRNLLTRMGLDPDRVLHAYQHELSGGMRQRVGIMLALVLNAHVVILDEADHRARHDHPGEHPGHHPGGARGAVADHADRHPRPSAWVAEGGRATWPSCTPAGSWSRARPGRYWPTPRHPYTRGAGGPRYPG